MRRTRRTHGAGRRAGAIRRVFFAIALLTAAAACAPSGAHAKTRVRGFGGDVAVAFGARSDILIHTPVRVGEGVEFSITAPNADSVSIVGTWNDWDRRANAMTRADESEPWRCVAPLSEGVYQFKARYVPRGGTEWLPYPEPDPAEDEVYDESNSLTLVIETDGDVYLSLGGGSARSAAIGLSGDYNRVDGFAPWLVVAYDRRDRVVPRVRLAGGYAFALERGGFDARVEVPLVSRYGPAVAAEIFQKTSHFDDRRITHNENAFAAFFLSEDFRDYVRDRGGRASLIHRMLPSHEIALSYEVHDYDPVARQTDWSVFGAEKEFRENDLFGAGDDGVMRGVVAEYSVDSRRDHRDTNFATGANQRRDSCLRGSALATRYERAGARLGGDFHFERWDADARHFAKLSRRIFAAARVAGGKAKSISPGDGEPLGAVPRERRYYLGGIGTLRGHEFKEFEGTRYALGNLEVSFVPASDFALTLFTDVGDAWDRDPEAKLRADIGVGAGSLDGAIRVDVARPVESDSDGATRVTVRAARTF
ncbi:MAG: BamA/TamA family outer membrane protein [bacterium]